MPAREQFHAPERDGRCEIQSEERLYTLTNCAGITAAPSFQNSSKDTIFFVFTIDIKLFLGEYDIFFEMTEYFQRYDEDQIRSKT